MRGKVVAVCVWLSLGSFFHAVAGDVEGPTGKEQISKEMRAQKQLQDAHGLTDQQIKKAKDAFAPKPRPNNKGQPWPVGPERNKAAGKTEIRLTPEERAKLHQNAAAGLLQHHDSEHHHIPCPDEQHKAGQC